jgi:hypothetical protein
VGGDREMEAVWHFFSSLGIVGDFSWVHPSLYPVPESWAWVLLALQYFTMFELLWGIKCFSPPARLLSPCEISSDFSIIAASIYINGLGNRLAIVLYC